MTKAIVAKLKTLSLFNKMKPKKIEWWIMSISFVVILIVILTISRVILKTEWSVLLRIHLPFSIIGVIIGSSLGVSIRKDLHRLPLILSVFVVAWSSWCFYISISGGEVNYLMLLPSAIGLLIAFIISKISDSLRVKPDDSIPLRKFESELPIIQMDFLDRMRKKAEKSFSESKIPFSPQTILDSNYDFLLQEAQNASYSEYSIEKLSPGKYGIVEYGERKEMIYVMLSDKLYTQAPNSTGWVYGLEKIGTFSFDLPSGIRHDTCRIVSIENTSTEKALLRYNYFIEATNINFPEPIKRNQEFIDGIWFAVQHMVIVRDMPTIAAGIIKEADLTLSECEGAQKRSGSFNTQMKKFIKKELA